MAQLDLEFIAKAERVTSFNLPANAFMSLKHKQEIQHLFNKHYFPKFDLTKTVSRMDPRAINSLIAQLKAESMQNFKDLHKYNVQGLGPGEVTMYFLIDSAHLSGWAGSGIDLVIGSSKYEVKAVRVSGDKKTYNGFRLGGTVPLHDVIGAINQLREEIRVPGTRTEINISSMKMMRDRAPRDMAKIDTLYSEVAYEHYFRTHEVVFVNNNESAAIGQIENVLRVKPAQITVDRLTSGNLTPRITL